MPQLGEQCVESMMLGETARGRTPACVWTAQEASRLATHTVCVELSAAGRASPAVAIDSHVCTRAVTTTTAQCYLKAWVHVSSKSARFFAIRSQAIRTFRNDLRFHVVKSGKHEKLPGPS